MAVQILTTRVFLRNVKKLAKRYASLKDDLIQFRISITENPLQGTDLGDDKLPHTTIKSERRRQTCTVGHKEKWRLLTLE